MKYLNYLPLIPAVILVLLIVNGISQRSGNSQLAFAIEDSTDYFNNPKLQIKPIKTKISKEVVTKSKGQKPCLVIYNNKAYEIPPELFELHKGGLDHLTQACGTDITFLFNLMPHTKTAHKLLDQLYYAELNS